jgi:hypothetical protein
MIGVDPHMAEVMSEEGLKEEARFLVEGLTRRSQDLPYGSRRNRGFHGSARLSLQLLLFAVLALSFCS